MTRGADGVYTASLDAKSDPAKSAGLMKVWMTAGDDRKDLDPITVLPRLAIARVEAVITPPAYVTAGDGVKRPPSTSLTARRSRRRVRRSRCGSCSTKRSPMPHPPNSNR